MAAKGDDTERMRRPDPDPTEATSAQLRQAIGAAEDKFDARLDGMDKARKYYVYVGGHPVTGMPCYFGKGVARRIWKHGRLLSAGTHPNGHLQNIYAKHGPIVWTIVRANLTEIEAFETEKSLVSYFGRVNSGTGILCNRTDGGDGVRGYAMPDERRSRMKGIPPTKAIEMARIANTGKPLSSEHRKKLSDAQSAVMNSPAIRNKTSISLKGISRSPETRQKMSAWRTGRVFGTPSPEHRAKLSAASKGKPKTPEHIAKVVAARVAFFERKRMVAESNG